MNQRLDLSGLRDGLDLPPTDVAAGAWERGRRRVRRRRAAGAAAVVAVVAAVILVPGVVGDRAQRGLAPAGPPAPTETVGAGAAAYAAVADDDLEAEADRILGEALVLPQGEVTDLSEDPVDVAALAVERGDDVLVVGDDGRTRRVDAAGDAVLAPRSIGPGGDRLLLVEPDAVVSVDLATGDSVRSELPPGGDVDEPVTVAGWLDDARAVVVNGGRGGAVVDTATGALSASDVGAPTALGPDGPVSWVGGELLTPDRVIRTRATASDSAAQVVGDGVAIAGTAARDDQVGLEGVGSALPFLDGPLVVDLATGDPLAYLPVPAVRRPPITAVEPLAVDGDQVVLHAATGRTQTLMRWDWRTGEVSGLLQLRSPFSTVSWGPGGDRLVGG